MGFVDDIGSAVGNIASGGMNVMSGGMVGSGPLDGMMGMGGGLGGIGGMMGMGGGSPLNFLMGGNTPQDQGYGIASPVPFQPYQMPGLQPGDPSGMESLDLTGPGARESFFDQNSGQFGATGLGESFYNRNGGFLGVPGQSESFAQEMLGQYGGGNNPTTTNRAEQAFQGWQSNMPSLNADAGLDPYYDRAVDLATNDVNSSLAASGLLGSSAGQGQVSQAVTDLRADQASREAQHDLNVAGELRNQYALGGQLGSSADSSSAMGSNNALSWMQGLGGLAGQADQFGLNRFNTGFGANSAIDNYNLGSLMSGMSAAGMADQGQLDRANTLFGNQMALGGAYGNVMMPSYDAMLTGDQALMDSSIAAELGLGAEALAQDQGRRQQLQNDVSWTGDTLSGIMSLGQGRPYQFGRYVGSGG